MLRLEWEYALPAFLRYFFCLFVCTIFYLFHWEKECPLCQVARKNRIVVEQLCLSILNPLMPKSDLQYHP